MDGIRAQPYVNPLFGSANDIIGGLLGYMRDPNRTQQLQGLAGLLQSTGIPKSIERLAYGEPLTNIQKANVPTLMPETAEALMTLLPVPSGTNKAAMAAGRAGERLAERVVPQIMERGGMPASLLGDLSKQTVSPLTVYHGSPHKFSKFDASKIGTGEGAQSYGHGLYVAESPEVAKGYQSALAKESKATDLNTKMQMVDVGGKPLTSFNVDMDASFIDAAKSGKKEFLDLASSKKARWETLAQDESYPFKDYAKEKIGAYNTLLDSAKKSDVDYVGSGLLYEINLPDEQIAKMLDWDKPLSKQPENVRAALEKFGYKVDRAEVDQYSDALLDALMTDAQVNLPKQPLDMSGENIYRKLRQSYQNNERLNAERDALISKYQKEGMSWSDSVRAMSKEDRAKFVDIASQIESQKDASAMTSEALRQAGIPGIRYLDQGSRGAGEGTSNFVVFPGNEDLLTILKRNGGLLGP